MRSGAMPTRVCLLRHKSDTIDLLLACFAVLYEAQSGLPERYRAAGTRRFLQLARWRARHDQVAQLVVQHEQLADRLPSLESGSPALMTPTGTAAGAINSNQPLRQHRVQR